MKASKNAQVIEFEQATSYRRLGARIIDLVLAMFVLLIPSVPISIGIGTLVAGGNKELETSVSGWLFFVTFVVLAIGYDTVLHRLFGKTMGKWLLGMRVVDTKGEKLGWGSCFLRAIGLYVSGIVIAFATAVTASIVGWIFIGTLGRYRRFPHDSLSKSFVVLESKGQLKKAETVAGSPGIALVGPAADLERLHSQGLISEDEYQRKRKEIQK